MQCRSCLSVCHFFHCQNFIARSLANDKSTLTDFDMLLMIKESSRGGMRHANHQYTEANSSYMEDHDKNKCPLYILYWDVNNWCGWAM